MTARDRKRVRLGLAATLAVTASTAVAVVATSAARPAVDRTAGPASVAVPLKVLGSLRSAKGAQPVIQIKVGSNGPTVPVVLDTGSVGLHIYSQGVKTGPGSGVVVSTHKNSISYVSGELQTGVIAKAKVTVGGQTTSTPIAFGLIQHVGCVESKPHCPTSKGALAVERNGRYGVMGVGIVPVPASVPPNPLRHLPKPYSSAWSVALSGSSGKGTLTLGASPPTKPLAVLSMPKANGVPPFNDRKLNVCWKVGSATKACEPTLFDSGDVSMEFFGGRLGATSPKGQPVSASLPGASNPFWTLTPGAPGSENAAAHPTGAGVVNTGSQAFFDFTITYDGVKGIVSLSPSP